MFVVEIWTKLRGTIGNVLRGFALSIRGTTAPSRNEINATVEEMIRGMLPPDMSPRLLDWWERTQPEIEWDILGAYREQ